MSAMSLKEKALVATFGTILLYAFAVVLWFTYFNVASKSGAWRKAIDQYEKSVKRYRDEEKLISQKNKWTEAYEVEKARMPMFETGKATDTTWLQKMDELASQHHIAIASRQGGKEVEAGDVLELPIDVRTWEGSLEALVRFVHELENTDEGMFDIRSLSFRPNTAKKGYLKGSFILTCAYMREK